MESLYKDDFTKHYFTKLFTDLFNPRKMRSTFRYTNSRKGMIRKYE